MASTSGVSLRSTSQIFLVGPVSHHITGCKLPSNRQVLSTLFFNLRTNKKLSVRDSAKLVIREVNLFWTKARIPTKYEKDAITKVEKLYKKWANHQKNSKKTSAAIISQFAKFSSTLDDLFDIAHQNALDSMSIEEDKEFLLKQREKGRTGCMIGVDARLAQVEERRSQRMAAEMKRRIETFQFDYDQDYEEPDQLTASSSESSLMGSTTMEPDEPEKKRMKTTSRGTKEIVTTKLSMILDRCKVTDRNAVMILSATIEALELNPIDYIISRSALRSRRQEFREKYTEEMHKRLSIPDEEPLVVHWDAVLEKIEALHGETVYLPCNISTIPGDDIILILWYKENIGTPVYSVDIRKQSTHSVKRWSDKNAFAERAYFIIEKEPGALSIQDAKYTDSGIYRCRIDFQKAQTRNVKIMLSIIAPPSQVKIYDESHSERTSFVGPYNAGDIIALKCLATGGIPPPILTWYQDDHKLKATTEYVTEKGIVYSTTILGPLTRNHLNSKIKCRGYNHPRITTVEAVVHVDMNFAPLDIRILGAHQPLSANLRYDLLCQSSGSRPPAVITWWLNGLRLENSTETTSSDGNVTTSTLSIIFTKMDTEKLLTCKSYNSEVPSEVLEEIWTLNIQYIAETHVRLGSSLNPETIKEGTDVYFDCIVDSHPPVYRIEWKHNGHVLPRNISLGMIISNQSLVLQGVTKSAAGNYTCVGYNTEGEGISQPLILNILYSPICSLNHQRIYGVAKQENAKIKCSVDANPQEVDFSWAFNNSVESVDVATNHIYNLGTSSTVTYRPITEQDYGTLLCTATNKIGKQKIPCIFHIIAAGRPDQVHNCSLSNVSMTSLTVTCIDGFNGGLPQFFILELLDATTKEIKANITSTISRFTVSSLSPGSLYNIHIYSFNSRGRSDPVILNAAMLKMPEKQLTFDPAHNSRTNFLVPPLLSLTAGLVVIIFLAGLVLVFAIKIPISKSNRRQHEFSNEPVNLSPENYENNDIQTRNNDENNPDVIESTESDGEILHSSNFSKSTERYNLAQHHDQSHWASFDTFVPAVNIINRKELYLEPNSSEVQPMDSNYHCFSLNDNSLTTYTEIKYKQTKQSNMCSDEQNKSLRIISPSYSSDEDFIFDPSNFTKCQSNV